MGQTDIGNSHDCRIAVRLSKLSAAIIGSKAIERNTLIRASVGPRKVEETVPNHHRPRVDGAVTDWLTAAQTVAPDTTDKRSEVGAYLFLESKKEVSQLGNIGRSSEATSPRS